MCGDQGTEADGGLDTESEQINKAAVKRQKSALTAALFFVIVLDELFKDE